MHPEVRLFPRAAHRTAAEIREQAGHEIVGTRRIGGLARHAVGLVDGDEVVVLVDDPRLVEVQPELQGRLRRAGPAISSVEAAGRRREEGYA
jgi:hypothetical protein